MSAIQQLLSEAVRLLRESGRHFKSRQVAEARRLIQQAITQSEEQEHAEKTLDDHPEKTACAPPQAPDDDHTRP